VRFVDGAEVTRAADRDPFLLLLDLPIEQLQKRQALAQQRAVGFWQLEPPQMATAFDSKEIAALGQLQLFLPL
jgi:hypothetical protein